MIHLCFRALQILNRDCYVNKYPHFGFKLDEVDAFLRNRYIVEFSLLLSEKFEPPARGRFDEFRYTKGQGSHKIISGRSIPIPYLDQQPSILIFRFEVASKSQIALTVIRCTDNCSIFILQD